MSVYKCKVQVDLSPGLIESSEKENVLASVDFCIKNCTLAAFNVEIGDRPIGSKKELISLFSQCLDLIQTRLGDLGLLDLQSISNLVPQINQLDKWCYFSVFYCVNEKRVRFWISVKLLLIRFYP